MGVDVFDTLDESSMKCIRFDVCKAVEHTVAVERLRSSMKCIRFDVCKVIAIDAIVVPLRFLNEVHTF